jgi:hypothetical protein
MRKPMLIFFIIIFFVSCAPQTATIKRSCVGCLRKIDTSMSLDYMYYKDFHSVASLVKKDVCRTFQADSMTEYRRRSSTIYGKYFMQEIQDPYSQRWYWIPDLCTE